MDILSFNAIQQLSRKVAREILDPWKKPAFAVVSVNSSSYWGTVVYNHYLQEMARKNYMADTYHQETTSNNATEFFNIHYQWGQTDSGPGTSSSSYGNLTSRCGHIGHIALGVGPDGTMIGRHQTASGMALRNVGVWVNNQTNKNLALFMENQYAAISPRSVAMSYRMSYEGNHIAWTNSKFYNQNGYGTRNKWGMIGYNEKTRTLVINENTAASTAMRLHIYTDVDPINVDADDRRSWFDNIDEANHTTFDWTANDASNIESYYRAVVVPCDDGKIIIVRMAPSSYGMLDRFTPDGAGSYTKETTHTLSTTTAYGAEQGSHYGVRFQISNDGKYILTYQPYYYYGGGAEVFLIRVSDGQYAYLQHQDSSNGRSFVPIREKGFLMTQSIDADSGAGMSSSHIDPALIFRDIADKANMSGKIPDFGSQLLDSAYTSTNYPFIVPILGGS
ncbi:MAG: hypothetical protein HQL72_09015 [Magnetococcales bacterium]|nr:hypothetical protein [Magnetococcales bacterium]